MIPALACMYRLSKSPLLSLQPYKALLTWKEYKADEFDIRQLITALENNLKTELAYMARDIMQSKSKAIVDSLTCILHRQCIRPQECNTRWPLGSEHERPISFPTYLVGQK